MNSSRRNYALRFSRDLNITKHKIDTRNIKVLQNVGWGRQHAKCIDYQVKTTRLRLVRNREDEDHAPFK